MSSPETPSGVDPATIVDAHVDTQRSQDPPRVAPREIGRFVVLGRAGQGGMGEVLRAYDPKLRREVAIKRLYGAGRDELRARAVREARAMAQLAHPNIVAVFDADDLEGVPYIAMEFVEGETLSEWAKSPRHWSAVLTVMIGAGEGLAAAHDAGIIHRDFKPSNVIVSRDGRARVTDFGIARQHNATEASARVDLVDDSLTLDGTVSGTPAYMAPEVCQGEPSDARSDLYSFALTVWELFYGARPFDGSLGDVVSAKARGQLPSQPKGTAVPRGVHRELVRALAPRPSARHRDMRALLAALTNARDRTRRNRRLLVLAGLGLVGLGVWAAWLTHRDRQIAGCRAQASEIAAAWSVDARPRLAEAFARAGVSGGEVLLDRASVWLDDHAIRWQAARAQLCIDTEVTPRGSPEVTEAIAWCLEDARVIATTLIDVYSGVTSATDAYGVVGAAASLPSPTNCREGDRSLMANALPMASRREEVEDILAQLAGATIAVTRRDPGAAALAADVHARAGALGWVPLVVRAGVRACRAGAPGDRQEETAELCERMFFEASAAKMPLEAADAAIELVVTVGENLGRADDGRRWARHAELALADVASGGDLSRYRLLSALGNLELRAGAYAEAKTIHEEAVAHVERTLGENHPEVMASTVNLAIALQGLGHSDEALASYQSALEAATRSHGPGYPQVALILGNIGTLQADRGLNADAIASYERALEIFAAAWGPQHRVIAMLHNNIAQSTVALGDLAGAQRHQERALTMLSTTLGPEHPDVAQARWGLASIALEAGDFERAERESRLALELRERVLGREHPEVGQSLHLRGMIAFRRGALDESRPDFERALAISVASHGESHVDVVTTLVALTTLALDQGRSADALALGERAVRLLDTVAASPVLAAEARLALAKAVFASDPARARELATRAAADVRDLPRSSVATEVAQWLAQPANGGESPK